MKTIKRVFSSGICFILFLSITISAFADGTDEIMAVDTNGYPAITAKASVLMEATTGQVLFENASSEKLPISHITKLMTLLLTIEKIKANELTFETTVTTSSTANSMGDPQIWLNKGEQISVDELIKSITIGNANDACVSLAEAVGGSEDAFVTKMNVRATELGMKNTLFMNSTGIDCEGQYSTAYDIALLARELLKYEELTPYFNTWMINVREGKTNLVNSNLLVKNFSGITGMKAATSKAAGNCLVATSKRNGLNIICVILNSKTKEQRFLDAKNAMNYAYNANEMFISDVSAEKLKSIQVKGGEFCEVAICPENTTSIIIPKGSSSNIKTELLVDDFVSAPVKKNQVVGRVQFFSNEKLLLETNIITKTSVKKMSVGIALNKLVDNLIKI